MTVGQAPPPPPPKRRRRGPWIAAVVIVVVAGAGIGAWFLTRDSGEEAASSASTTTALEAPNDSLANSTTSGTAPGTVDEVDDVEPVFEDEWGISSDQLRIVEEFGPPRTFTVVYGQDADEVLDAPYHRFEYWDYNDMGVRFVFRDGGVVATHDTPMLGPMYDYPAVMPWWFSAGMTPSELSDLFGFEPLSSGTLLPNEKADLTMLVWDGLTAVTFAEGFLIAVETAPVEVER